MDDQSCDHPGGHSVPASGSEPGPASGSEPGPASGSEPGPASGSEPGPAWAPSPLLRAHAAMVVGLLAAFAVLLALDPPGGDGGANFGLALPGLPLIAFGLPWSAWTVVALYALDGLPSMVALATLLGPAVLNVATHAALYRWWRHRRGRPAPLVTVEEV